MTSRGMSYFPSIKQKPRQVKPITDEGGETRNDAITRQDSPAFAPHGDSHVRQDRQDPGRRAHARGRVDRLRRQRVRGAGEGPDPGRDQLDDPPRRSGYGRLRPVSLRYEKRPARMGPPFLL